MSGAIGLAVGNALLLAVDQAPVVLGPVIFAGHEVPSRIVIGGAHAVAIHKLPGGGRIIDAMGQDDGAICWSGYFTGPIASTRARVVDAMRRNGKTVGLSFGDYTFNVVVVHFEYDLQDRGALISYRIRTEILPDPIALLDDTSLAIEASLSNDIVAATAALSGLGSSAALVAIGSLGAAVAVPSAMTSPTTLAAIGLALQASAGAVQYAITQNGAGLPTALLGANPGISSAAALTAAVTAAGRLGAATNAAGYVNRSGSWLHQLAGQPQGLPLILA